MKLLIYTKLFRDKFQKEIFLCENDLLLFVLSGSFEVKHHGRFLRVDENQAFLFSKGESYERRILSPMSMALFRYESEESLFPCPHIVFKDTARVRSTLMLADACASLPDAAARREQLLCDLKNQYEIEHACAQGCTKAEDGEMLIAERKMREGLDGFLPITAIASEFALSHVQFIRRFKAAFGRTPSEHIAHLRIERAKGLLTQTSYPIKSIAQKCGFESEYYFSNFFKKHTAFSPSEYRTMTF